MALPAARKTLVLVPHPDDESLGCGGTLKLIASSGGVVDALYLTRGELGFAPGAAVSGPPRHELAQRRVREAEQACRLLGVRNVTFLHGMDGQLRSQPELSGEVLRALQSQDYCAVFSPWPRDGHTDHAATYAMLHWALQQYARDIDVWLYEVWTPLEPNTLVPIDATIEAKMAAIRAHESQLALVDYVTGFRALAQYRSLLCPMTQYAEAFFTCDRLSLLAGEDLPWLRHIPPVSG